MAKGVLMLPSYYEAIKELPDLDRLALYDCIVRYGLYGEDVELPAHLRGLFTLIKPQIDSSRRRYDAAVGNGNKGGRPPKNQMKNQTKNQMKNQSRNQEYDYDYEYEYDSKGFQQTGPSDTEGLAPWVRKAEEARRHE